MHFLATEQAAQRNYDVLCVLYATAPLRNANDIRAVIELLEPGVCDHALAACGYQQPAHQTLKQLEGANISPMWPDLVARRESSLPNLVVGNGSTYAVTTKAFMAAPGFYSARMRAHVMPWSRSVDIDHEDDLELARFYAQRGSS